MPELPEVEVVRTGLEHWVRGRTVHEALVLHPRAVRRHAAGAEDFAARLKDRAVTEVRRRGKYLWLNLDSGDALLAHLGMSGQLLVQPRGRPDERHLRVRLGLGADNERELRFVDQRTFGHLMVEPLAPDVVGRSAGVPAVISHIALDPLDPDFDDAVFTAALRRRRTEIKRALLDQSLISGVGNIYADEALWRARLHWARPTATLRPAQVAELLARLRDVLREALAEGGTSFDSLYVNVNGESGYFERGLNAYGRRDLPCRRCGTPIRRDPFMNRSSFSCPRCQPAPRRRVGGG
ncbi:bifunctional DNA-formamidopyrimidine glycosylase/DNA-(apurinic or apyrimidinic site) lyase [Streptomonospora nanhaiensis]|uniref:Formamidopyrimidine-DNA glycosylase n=1 Tax=Streptomonospora nanhaiensis TaxID=1323731 RepID=A0A853BSW3_9ACTN|nr:bifunctional DNA-formamidopyrimidine glycosylase/DNA-(apurinic or apyrimidinic site) lyase [Streptomonospora nanhaiensis]MBV2362583.1 bifunctional DNA-formamidopyrimidine glycosylase/DNA-(apurinic or apyrimidinic site) lyase [Streptomonospora nanhaiensis]MBX9386862.1 bifunctional DNA-formamidopyrimidine glycosylase/DNA-(apurinic or apyrimidinic site) lyase [Streptomonospora nanhaiensis]NYI98070.1 formamidopyrimidine-DNA glycosylase [Streptomonospora nanhaiensis]